jgi:hypothetical protein
VILNSTARAVVHAWGFPTNDVFVEKEIRMSFALYLIGFLIFIGGVAWALVAAGVPSLYIGIACVILLGVGILTGVSRTRSKDPS